ncbi:MAG: hypothetical protein AAGH53_13975 [Pseudomonadota bacterium]
MSDDQDIEDRPGFAETPSKEEWLGLLRDLSSDLAAMELRIHQIKSQDLSELEEKAYNMRERMAIILNRLDK